jgi:hypothetical protein
VPTNNCSFALLTGKATNTNYVVIGLTRAGLTSMIYHTRCEHANHYTTDAIVNQLIGILVKAIHFENI